MSEISDSVGLQSATRPMREDKSRIHVSKVAGVCCGIHAIYWGFGRKWDLQSALCKTLCLDLRRHFGLIWQLSFVDQRLEWPDIEKKFCYRNKAANRAASLRYLRLRKAAQGDLEIKGENQKETEKAIGVVKYSPKMLRL